MNYHSIVLPKYLNQDSITLLKQQQLEIESSVTKVLVISGVNHRFCYGLDFTSLNIETLQHNTGLIYDFVNFLNFVKSYQGISISLVAGRVMGGGVGIVAASDIVLATDKSSFQLTEGLFGLIPAVIMPFLLQKLRPQIIKRMVLTADPLSANDAVKFGLIDRVVKTAELKKQLNFWLKKLNRCQIQSVIDLKKILSKSDISNESLITDLGLQLLQKQLNKPKIQQNLSDFANFSLLPQQERRNN